MLVVEGFPPRSRLKGSCTPSPIKWSLWSPPSLAQSGGRWEWTKLRIGVLSNVARAALLLCFFVQHPFWRKRQQGIAAVASCFLPSFFLRKHLTRRDSENGLSRRLTAAPFALFSSRQRFMPNDRGMSEDDSDGGLTAKKKLSLRRGTTGDNGKHPG